MNLPSITVSIAASASKSGAAYLGGSDLVGIITPAAWTAAVMTFEASIDGVDYFPLVDRYGTEITFAITAGRHSDIEGGAFLSTPYLKVVSGTAASAVNQEAARPIKLVVRKLA
jgi:hypothetical protein